MPRLGVFPGSFNPPTIAHLAIAEQAYRQHYLDRIDLMVSRRALAKEHVIHPRFEHRIEVLEQTVAKVAWLEVATTDDQLLSDIADGYDLLVMGADKWWEIHQPEWYESSEHRQDALGALPAVAVVPRHGYHAPPERVLRFDADTYGLVSSTRAREGELDLMTGPAREFAEKTGAWTDLERYRNWLNDQIEP